MGIIRNTARIILVLALAFTGDRRPTSGAFRYPEPIGSSAIAGTRIYGLSDMPELEKYHRPAVQFIGELDGWVGGGLYRDLGEHGGTSNRFYAGDGSNRGLFAAVFTTEDGGQTWSSQPVVPSDGDIDRFLLLDRNHGWAFGEAGDFYLKDGRWWAGESRVDAQGESTAKCQELEIGCPTYCPAHEYFLNARVGWMANSNGYLGKSTDGGKTWEDIYTPPASEARPISLVIAPVLFVDELNGWGLDSDGDLRLTKDGGVTWSQPGLDLELEDIYVLDANHVWAASRNAIFRLAL